MRRNDEIQVGSGERDANCGMNGLIPTGVLAQGTALCDAALSILRLTCHSELCLLWSLCSVDSGLY